MQTNYIIETSGEVHLKTQEEKEEEEGEGEGPFPHLKRKIAPRIFVEHLLSKEDPFSRWVTPLSGTTR